MKFMSKLFVAGALAATMTAAPAAAQVEGKIATVNAPLSIINTNAFKTANESINTTYKTQTDTITTRAQERQTLLQQLDTNGDKQLDEAEQTAAQGTPQATRIAAIDEEINQLSGQVELARIYVVDQILAQYGASVEAVAQAQQIQMVVTPDAVIYAPPAASITQQVSAQLNTRVPSAQVVPQPNYRPSRNAVATYQQIQQTLLTIQALQAQQAAQQQPTQAPSGR